MTTPKVTQYGYVSVFGQVAATNNGARFLNFCSKSEKKVPGKRQNCFCNYSQPAKKTQRDRLLRGRRY